MTKYEGIIANIEMHLNAIKEVKLPVKERPNGTLLRKGGYVGLGNPGKRGAGI